MGSDQSKNFDACTPVGQPVPICGIEPRFCLPRPVQLKIKEKYFSFSGDDFGIKDANDGTIYFKCAGKAFSLKEKKTLLDNMGNPVANLKEGLFTLTDKFTLYAGNNSDRKICKFRTEYNFMKAKLYAIFQDAANGQQRYLVLKGDWRSKKAIVFLGEPKQGGIPLAKIYRPLTARSYFLDADEYILDIAPGVDIALLVMMCIALDEHKKDN